MGANRVRLEKLNLINQWWGESGRGSDLRALVMVPFKLVLDNYVSLSISLIKRFGYVKGRCIAMVDGKAVSGNGALLNALLSW